MKIMPNRLDRGFYLYQREFEQKALEVLRSGWYILGREGSSFEEEFAAYTGSRYCVGLASGLDALWIAFRILGIGQGDEVIVQGNTYIASVMGITINGATPVFVEPDEYYNINADKIEEKITERTKAILVVHLYGQASNMAPIMDTAKRHGLRVVEDCAQSHGACFQGQMTGTFGDIGCFSIPPKIWELSETAAPLSPMIPRLPETCGYSAIMEVRNGIIIKWWEPIPGWMNCRPDCCVSGCPI